LESSVKGELGLAFQRKSGDHSFSSNSLFSFESAFRNILLKWILIIKNTILEIN